MVLDWGSFKALETGLGLGGYNAPTFLQKFNAGVYPNMSFGSLFGNIGDNITGLSRHFNDNKDLYNFGANLAMGYGNFTQQNDAAKAARKMNDFYMNQFKREQDRQDKYTQDFNNAWGGSSGKVG
jgi:hypothetical protein